MTGTLAFIAELPRAAPLEYARVTIVCACALALICAGQPLPCSLVL